MRNLLVESIVTGILIAEGVSGMQNSMPSGINNNNSGNKIGNCASDIEIISDRNTQNNDVFIPVRRFSEGMINFSIWPEPKNPGMGQDGCIVLEQQQNSRELSIQNNANNGPYVNQGINQAKLPVQNALYTPPPELPPEQINANTNQNMIFLPILRRQNSRNQTKPKNNSGKFGYSNARRNSNADLPPLYNNQGYFSPSGIDKDIMNPHFNLSEVLKLVEQQTQINIEKVKRETQQELLNLKQQNEILLKEIQNYRNREMYFYPDKIAELQRQIMNLEGYITNQEEKHRKEINELKDQRSGIKLDKVIILEQQNEELSKEIQRYKDEDDQETPKNINLLKKQVKELQNQIMEENAIHEAKINDLKEQLQKEKELNVTLSLSSSSVLENQN